MQIINCIIVDDDMQACNALQHDVLNVSKDIKIVAVAHSVADAKEKIQILQPQLVLLDIKLGDGSGFDVLDYFKNPNFKVIFITAFNEYAIKAFKVNALDYLLKPIDNNELLIAINKVKDFFKGNLNIEKQNKTLTASNIKRVSFTTADGISVHEIDSIIYCEASRNYCTIYFTHGEKLFVAKPLAEIQSMLANNLFERIHQTYLINLIHLKKYSNKEGGYVFMSNGIKLPVARRKKADLLLLLETITV